MKNIAVTERERRVRDSVGDLEDEVDHLRKNYKSGRYQEARQNLDVSMLLASSLNRFMLRHYFSAEASRAWRNLKGDLNVIAFGYGIPPLPDLVVTTVSSGGGTVASAGPREEH